MPTMFGIDQEISLAAHGRMDTQKGGKEKPWRKLRIKPEFNMAEEERKRAFVERVTGTLREKLKDGSLGGGEDEPNAGEEVSGQYIYILLKSPFLLFLDFALAEHSFTRMMIKRTRCMDLLYQTTERHLLNCRRARPRQTSMQ